MERENLKVIIVGKEEIHIEYVGNGVSRLFFLNRVDVMGGTVDNIVKADVPSFVLDNSEVVFFFEESPNGLMKLVCVNGWIVIKKKVKRVIENGKEVIKDFGSIDISNNDANRIVSSIFIAIDSCRVESVLSVFMKSLEARGWENLSVLG